MGRTSPNNVTCLIFFLPSFNSSPAGQKVAAILADNIFKCIFLTENDKIPIPISMKLVLRIPIDNKTALVQVMVWCRTGDKPLTEPMMVSLLMHICITRSQWVKQITSKSEENFVNPLAKLTALSKITPWSTEIYAWIYLLHFRLGVQFNPFDVETKILWFNCGLPVMA